VTADAGISWQDWVQLVGTIVSAGAAVGAIVFAWLTVREARELRREDRRARLGELVGDFSASLLRVLRGAAHERVAELPVARARLAAAVASVEEPLPACDRLVRLDTEASYEEVQLQTAFAVDELAGVDPAAP
jgi:hypothetical protein